jgi:hypothetical protein
VDDIMGAAVSKIWITKILEAIIEAIFVICGQLDTSIQQCPLSIKRWLELVVGPRQIVLGLVIDTNQMTISMTKEYLN